ncbi:hypothetical protein KI387_009129, partial [Taxus chinensis]
SYDYSIDGHKLKFFPVTLKYASLRWFMGLGRNDVTTWAQMKDKFLNKYQESYRPSIRGGDEMYIMQQKEDEPLEDYLEWFMFCVQKSKHTTDIPLDSLKFLFLKGLSDEHMDALDLIRAGEILKASFRDICDSCKNYSRATMKR